MNFEASTKFLSETPGIFARHRNKDSDNLIMMASTVLYLRNRFPEAKIEVHHIPSILSIQLSIFTEAEAEAERKGSSYVISFAKDSIIIKRNEWINSRKKVIKMKTMDELIDDISKLIRK